MPRVTASYEQRITAQALPTLPGVRRWFFCCPCGRRCINLHLNRRLRLAGGFRCRVCLNLSYATNNATRLGPRGFGRLYDAFGPPERPVRVRGLGQVIRRPDLSNGRR